MGLPRYKTVDPLVTSLYHCISQCARNLHLCSKNRKQWLEERMRLVSETFAVSVCGYSLMDNHFHVVARLDEEQIPLQWTGREVAQRWARVYPPRDSKRRPLVGVELEEWFDEMAKDRAWVNQRRLRLMSLSWFMKSLKEPLARQANGEDGCDGPFWRPRFKSIALLDERALLVTMLYVDLNPFAAGMTDTPEQASYTSIHMRLECCQVRGLGEQLRHAIEVAQRGGVLTDAEAFQLDRYNWLLPLRQSRVASIVTSEAKPPGDEVSPTATQRGLFHGFSLGQYVWAIDWAARLKRPGKSNMSSDAPSILDRLGVSEEQCGAAILGMQNRKRPWGAFLAFSASRLEEAARALGCKQVRNLNGYRLTD